MPRRIFVTANKIWAARAFWWEDHYQKRQQAKACPVEQAERTIVACQQMPSPVLDIDGSLDTWNYNSARAHPVDETIDLMKTSGTEWTMLVKWYWSEEEWEKFVKSFNGLPDPEALYEIVFDDYPRLEVVHNGLCTKPGTRCVHPVDKMPVVPIRKTKKDDEKKCTPKQ